MNFSAKNTAFQLGLSLSLCLNLGAQNALAGDIPAFNSPPPFETVDPGNVTLDLLEANITPYSLTLLPHRNTNSFGAAFPAGTTSVSAQFAEGDRDPAPCDTKSFRYEEGAKIIRSQELQFLTLSNGFGPSRHYWVRVCFWHNTIDNEQRVVKNLLGSSLGTFNSPDPNPKLPSPYMLSVDYNPDRSERIDLYDWIPHDYLQAKLPGSGELTFQWDQSKSFTNFIMQNEMIFGFIEGIDPNPKCPEKLSYRFTDPYNDNGSWADQHAVSHANLKPDTIYTWTICASQRGNSSMPSFDILKTPRAKIVPVIQDWWTHKWALPIQQNLRRVTIGFMRNYLTGSGTAPSLPWDKNQATDPLIEKMLKDDKHLSVVDWKLCLVGKNTKESACQYARQYCVDRMSWNERACRYIQRKGKAVTQAQLENYRVSYTLLGRGAEFWDLKLGATYRISGTSPDADVEPLEFTVPRRPEESDKAAKIETGVKPPRAPAKDEF